MLPSGMPAERLLDWIDRYGSIGKVQRRWEYFRRDDKLASLFRLIRYPISIAARIGGISRAFHRSVAR